MGNPKQKWTAEEEEALRAGVVKHGTGKWKNIQKDPEFNHLLHSRSNIDLKDKWRNLSVSAGTQAPREKSKVTKPKTLIDSSPAPSSAAIVPVTDSNASSMLHSVAAPHPPDDSMSDQAMDDKSQVDDLSVQRQIEMILEALVALNNPNGSDASAIFNFIEHRHKVPQTYRRPLSTRLRRMVQQGKIYKIQNCYKLKNMASPGTRVAAAAKQKDSRAAMQLLNSNHMTSDTAEGAAATVAYRIAEAENTSFVAAEAVKEAERVSMMAEETESFLIAAKEIFRKCSQGEVAYAV